MVKMSSKELRKLVNKFYECRIPESGEVEDEEEFNKICTKLADLTEDEDDLFIVATSYGEEYRLWEMDNLEVMYLMERDTSDGHYKGNFIERMVINGREVNTSHLEVYYDEVFLFDFYPPYALD